MSSHVALLLGDYDRGEFRAAVAALRAACPTTLCRDLPAAAAVLDEGLAPTWLVVAASHGGQWSAAQIDALRQRCPLAVVIALLGTWCEGEERSGEPWPGALRLYWYEAAAQFPRYLRAAQAGCATAWNLPPTATAEERLIAELAGKRTSADLASPFGKDGGNERRREEFAANDAADPAAGPHPNPLPKGEGVSATAAHPLPNGEGVLATILSHDREIAAWLAAVCRRRGWSSASLKPDEHRCLARAGFVFFDCDDLRGGAAANGPADASLVLLQRVASHAQPAPVLVLCEFPRIETVEAALQAGAAAVLAKPLPLADLEETIDQCLRRPAKRG